MPPEIDKSFEARLDRALKALPALTAPRTLLPRILAEIERRATLPWYRHAWDAWPLSLRAASLAALMLIPAAMFYGTWELLWPGAVALGEKLELLTGVLATVGSAGVTVLRAVPGWLLQLDTGFLIAGAVMIVALAASGLGLGTFYCRFAYARR